VRLNSIKLSGFKSFADPTHFQLPGQLVGVVGPNGCGKSNIMDAVRWVLGESRASELRGESMQDVIFNGTNTASPPAAPAWSWCLTTPTTAPAGSGASFCRDRRQARADARRQQQLLHQQPAGAPPRRAGRVPGHRPGAPRLRHHRPRARSAASSSRKPEELRMFLEEAAGVSKYKERRRETENRLNDTRENLTRVEDILRELNANLDKLEKQAEVARATAAAGDSTLKQHQLWFLKRRDAWPTKAA
jgi:chromosome segregation protein